MIIRFRPKYEIASLRDAFMGLIPIPTLRKSEIFLYGVIEIKPLRGFFGAMRIVILGYMINGNWHTHEVAPLRDTLGVLVNGHRTALRLYGVVETNPLRGPYMMNAGGHIQLSSS